jgi:hypothetical protein
MATELRARDFERMLRTTIFDTNGAAQFLGIEPEGLIQAVYRRRIPYVSYRRMRFFARWDLIYYLRQRGPGRASELTPAIAYVVQHPPSLVDTVPSEASCPAVAHRQ